MPQLTYLIGYLDLRSEIATIFKNIKTRTEIRKAEKSGITIKIYQGDATPEIISACRQMLQKLLRREYVPYSNIFNDLLNNKNNYLLVAYRQNKVASFILLNPIAKHPFFQNHKTAFLELSGTEDAEKYYCPNYLLIWRAINFLKEQNFIYFNLGLLNYLGCPDSDLERVAFFKRKWAIQEQTTIENSGWGKYLYYHYFKRYLIVKKIVYLIKSILS